MNEVKRIGYINQLKSWKDMQIIKVITGIRRSGKSTLLQQYQDELRASGVANEQIISIRFEDFDNEPLHDPAEFYNYVKNRLCTDRQNYVFLDEVQMVNDFEKVVNSLYLRPNVDIYLTGSNSHMLSGELATLLSGRYVTIHIFPLSLAEYASVNEGYSLDIYNSYTATSSFPYALQIKSEHQLNTYLQDIYNTVVMRDVVMHNKVDNINMLVLLSRFLADNIGNINSRKRIADTITSAGTKTNSHTVDTYLQYLCDAYIFYPVQRYDVKGNEFLRIGQKYYIADIGLRCMLIGRRNIDRERILENVVYLELRHRGYEVYIGIVNAKEIDFVAQRDGVTEYYQIAESVVEHDTLKRELASLLAIRDHYPKFLLTLDNQPPVDYDGIHQLYVVNWLLNKIGYLTNEFW